MPVERGVLDRTTPNVFDEFKAPVQTTCPRPLPESHASTCRLRESFASHATASNDANGRTGTACSGLNQWASCSKFRLPSGPRADVTGMFSTEPHPMAKIASWSTKRSRTLGGILGNEGRLGGDR